MQPVGALRVAQGARGVCSTLLLLLLLLLLVIRWSLQRPQDSIELQQFVCLEQWLLLRLLQLLRLLCVLCGGDADITRDRAAGTAAGDKV
jgi:hypothetical protein